MKRGRKDANHNRLSDLFRALGCSVIDMPSTGIPGWPDACIGVIGLTHLVEYKNPESAYGRSGFNASQTAFNRDWRGEPVVLVSTDNEVIDLVQKWRKGKPWTL